MHHKRKYFLGFESHRFYYGHPILSLGSIKISGRRVTVSNTTLLIKAGSVLDSELASALEYNDYFIHILNSGQVYIVDSSKLEPYREGKLGNIVPY